MNRIPNAFLKWPLPSLVICVLAGVPWLLSLRDAAFRSDAQTMLEGDQRSLAAYEKVSAALNKDTVVVVSMAGEIFSPEGLQQLRAVGNAISDMPGLKDVKALTHSVKPVKKGFSFGFAPFVPKGELSEEDVSKIRAYATTHPLVKNIIVASDAKQALLICQFSRDLSTSELQKEFQRELNDVLRPFGESGYGFTTLALPLTALEVRSTLEKNLRQLIAWLGVMVVLLLWFAFRSVKLTLLCSLHLAFVSALLPGLMKTVGVPLTFYSLMLFPLVAAIQFTLMAHLFMGCRRAEGGNVKEAIEQTLRRVFKSCAFASVTTVVGLLSLTVCRIEQVSDFGIVGAAGITLAFLWTFGPGVSSLKLLLTNRPETQPASRQSKWAEWVAAQRKAILVFGILGLIAAGFGISKIRTDIRVTEFLDESSPTRVALQDFDEIYGGINVVQFQIDSGLTNGINSPQFLSFVDKVQQFAASKANVSGTYSYAQLMAVMNQVFEEEREGSLRVPDSPMTVGMFAMALQMRKFPFLDALADKDFKSANVIVRTRDMRSSEYLALLQEIVAFAEANQPEGITISAQEGIHSILEADQRVMDAQISSFAITIGVVGLTLFFLWKSLWLALLVLFVNLIPVALAVSLAGYGDMPLNSVTVMVAAIVFSIAVDDAVHFITWWRDEHERSRDSKAALISAFRTKGPPILCTSLILTTVFGAFLVFSFPPVRHFGILSAIAFMGAVLSTLALLPALLLPRERT